MFRSSIPLLLLAVACGPSFTALRTTPVTVQPEYESDRHDAVIRALAAKRYAVESDDGKQVIASWSKGSRFYRVAIDLIPNIELQYLESDVVEPAPPGMAPELYARYMHGLQRTIQKELGRPMRESAENAADQQEAALEAQQAAQRQEQRRLAEEARRRRVVLVTSGANEATIRAAIVKELNDRRYTVEGEDGNVIRARWSNDDRFYQLTLQYDPQQIVLQYVDSDHEDDDEEDGVQIIDERYIDYMGRLAHDISEEVNGA